MATDEPRSHPTLDFFLWGLFRNYVYAQKSWLMDVLKSQIEAFSHMEDLCRRACDAVPKRLKRCNELHNAWTELR